MADLSVKHCFHRGGEVETQSMCTVFPSVRPMKYLMEVYGVWLFTGCLKQGPSVPYEFGKAARLYRSCRQQCFVIIFPSSGCSMLEWLAVLHSGGLGEVRT